MNRVGVIVGRFQVDDPHEGHRLLVNSVLQKHGKVLILLGCSPIRLSVHDPLDYETRYKMMKSNFPSAVIMPVHDHSSDEIWSRNVDRLISQVFPTDAAVLYCSRRGFRSHYSGKWPTIEIDAIKVPSATELRETLSEQVRDSEDFRAGVIYACANRFPISYQVIDAAVLSKSPGHPLSEIKVLCCRKEYETQFQFLGGFVSPTDGSLEIAVKREVAEESHAEVDGINYVGSFRISDWRYQNCDDKILSAFFVATYQFGDLKPDDDLETGEIQWLPVGYIVDQLIDDHKEMGRKLITYLENQYKGGPK